MRRVVTKSLLLAHLVLVISSGGARADSSPPPFKDFTFKKVGVPSGAGKRIQVQIDPAQQAAALALPTSKDAHMPTAEGTAALTPSGYEWFWTSVSANLDGSGPANLQRAFVALEEKEGLAAPRLQHLQDIAKIHGVSILKATVGTDVSPAWVLALISVESAGRADAISSAGAQGVMQLIPATAARFGVEDASDPAQNIKGGVAYLAWLLKQFNGDPILAMAGYNAGENAVKDNQGVPPYPETRAYIPKVLAAWRVARGLCLTPPELLSDGCVFAVKGS